MASINKSFNFRHGVQVDDDDFTVRGGLVGIGTTVPTERLDVRGNAVVSGLTSSISLQVTGVTTLTTVDIGITSIKSGIITASSGIVTYYGDGQYLKFLPTSQWVDIDVGLGFTSIYNTGGNVGVSPMTLEIVSKLVEIQLTSVQVLVSILMVDIYLHLVL